MTTHEQQHKQQIHHLTELLDVSRELGATTALVPLLERVERAVLLVLNCERSTVFLHDPVGDELFSLVATGAESIRFDAKKGIAGEAFQTKLVVNVPDAYEDSRFNPEIDRQTGFRTRNILTFPMRGHDGRIVGVLQALNKREGLFDSVDEERADTLARIAGVAIQRQMLLDEFAKKQQLERDLSLARDIQQELLPTQDPNVPGYEIAGWNRPADETGGDCYDYVHFENGRIGVLLADATGHGIGPALIVSQCRAMVHTLAMMSDDPATILAQANTFLENDLSGGRFVATVICVLTPARHVARYLSCGQGPLLHYQRAEGRCREVAADTFPLGIVPELGESQSAELHLDPGDMFVLMTDGYFEWANPATDQFGIERVADLIHTHRDVGPKEIINRLNEAVIAFGEGTPQADDLTAVIIKRSL